MSRSRPKSSTWPFILQQRPPRRVFDPVLGQYVVRLHPGDCYATFAEDEIITTVLGSCVAACIRNPHLGYGGMNHFMLPCSESGDWGGASAALRYGNHAMEILIDAVLKSGCPRKDMEIKLFGGADFAKEGFRVGEQNARFALRYLEQEGLHPVSVDLGGECPRIIKFTPWTGTVERKLLGHPRISRSSQVV